MNKISKLELLIIFLTNQIIIIKVSCSFSVTGLSGNTDTAESMALTGVSILAGSAVMNLTLIWGSCVVFGNYDISDSSTPSPLETNKKPFSLTGLFPALPPP